MKQRTKFWLIILGVKVIALILFIVFLVLLFQKLR